MFQNRQEHVCEYEHCNTQSFTQISSLTVTLFGGGGVLRYDITGLGWVPLAAVVSLLCLSSQSLWFIPLGSTHISSKICSPPLQKHHMGPISWLALALSCASEELCTGGSARASPQPLFFLRTHALTPNANPNITNPLRPPDSFGLHLYSNL